MATKKNVVKTKKAVSKPASKTVANKKTAAPLKKSPAKAADKKTPSKAVKTKAVAKKTTPVKKAAPPKKAVAKKAIKAPAKAVAKPIKAVAKPASPVVKAVVKPAAKPAAPAAKAIKPAAAKPAAPTKQTKATIPPPPTTSKANTTKTTIMTEKINGSEKSRYSDAELKEFKGLIIGKLDEARAELINLNAAIISANENGTDDTGASFKMLEDGSDTLAKEEAAQLAARQKKFIEQLEAALVRIENKTYGVCRVTGKLIPKERLRAVPHTTQSMEAKLQQYKD